MEETIQPELGAEIFLYFGIAVGIFFGTTYIVRKLLHVERRKAFGKTYYSHAHKVIVRTFLTIFLVGMFIILISIPYSMHLNLNLYIFALGAVFTFIEGIIQVIMERKYAPNKNLYLLTITEMALLIGLFTFFASITLAQPY